MYPFAVLPWLVPGLVIAAAIAVPASRPLARWLPSDRRVAWFILTSFGLIVAATLTPLRGDLETPERWTGTCDLSRVGLAPVEWLVRLSDTSLNVALFVPLGIGIGLVAARHARGRLLVAAVLLPFVIEGLQLTMSMLDRGCQSADVIDNLTGLLIGLLLGSGMRLLARGPSDRRLLGR